MILPKTLTVEQVEELADVLRGMCFQRVNGYGQRIEMREPNPQYL